MKILYVVSAMLPWEVHGLAVHVKYLTEAMCKVADVTILYTVAANISGNKVKIIQLNGIKTILVPAGKDIQFPPNTPCIWMDASFPITQCWNEVVDIIAKEKYDVVHFQDYYTALTVEIIKKNCNAKIVTTIHAVSEKINHISSGIQYWLTANSDAVIAVSNWEQQVLKTRFPENFHRLVTIYNGTNMRYSASKNRNLITFAGRLEKKKGCDILLQAIAMIGVDKLEGFGKSVVIAGNGTEIEALKALAQKLGVERICKFVGEISHEEVNKLLSQSCIHVVPSRYEPFGLTSIEAMAKGAYVIVSNTGGLPETLFTSKIGVYIEKENVKMLADNIIQQLNFPVAEDLRKAESEKVTSYFNWENVAKETFNLYESLL